jgi:hypothetical protein
MNVVSNLSRLLVAATLALCANGTAVAEPSALDGKKFEGVFIERGKTSGDADTITFKDGRFRSSACDRFGYSDAPYKSTVAGDAIAFEAETESAKYGRLIWKGLIRNGKLDATAMMVRQGKPSVENWAVAASKP